MQVDSLFPYNSAGEKLIVVFFCLLGPRYAKALLLVSVCIWKFVAIFFLSFCMLVSFLVCVLTCVWDCESCALVAPLNEEG